VITTDLLTIDGIRRHLSTSIVGRRIYLFGEVESTNNALRRLARAAAPAGTVVLAEEQTSGRGRLGREWFSPSGVNLYASVLFRPALRPRDVGVFSLIACLALADAIDTMGAAASPKWPNDVLIDGKKVAGSLVECATRGDEVEHLILGVGVNLNVEPALIRAALGATTAEPTSVAAAIGHDVDRNLFAATYLNRLDAWARRHHGEGRDAVLDGWLRRDVLIGRTVEVRGAGAPLTGRAIGVDASGSLVVEDSLGHRHALSTEEVRLAE
jgi:BirA family biotin operon repressor/biotin-[acetyl-CoA-carboxylase] ligase